MKIVIMIDKSAGNESVGNMWTETLLFESDTTLGEIITAINPNIKDNGKDHFFDTVRLQIAQEV